MCGRITQKTNPSQLGLKLTVVNMVERADWVPRYNGSPGQEHWVIRQHPETGERTLDRLWWGLIPYWVKEANGGRKPVNAKGETVASLPSFRDAYKRRRCIVPVDNYFEWKATKGAKVKQPFAIGMKSGEPFGIAAIWENWRHPETGEWRRTFCVITCPPNELMADIHDRMPVILPAEAYDRWLANIEPDPRDLLAPFPSNLMTMWPVSTRANKPANDDPGILEPVWTARGLTLGNSCGHMLRLLPWSACPTRPSPRAASGCAMPCMPSAWACRSSTSP